MIEESCRNSAVGRSLAVEAIGDGKDGQNHGVSKRKCGFMQFFSYLYLEIAYKELGRKMFDINSPCGLLRAKRPVPKVMEV
jgi:hypothetical protein